jgi:lipopolysaccharide/colanic/teichoic acid biosynthesis glycosyltransferase
MSARLTTSRAVAALLQTTPRRHSATARQGTPQAMRRSEAPRSETCDSGGVRARTLPRIIAMTSLTDSQPARPALTLVRPLPIGPLDREGPARRVLNIAVAAVALVAAAPLMLLIAALIKLTSRGPVLFAQTRVGLDRRALSNAGGNTRRHTDVGGRPFTMYKFRTMRPTDITGPQVWAQPDDERVTPIGRVLRKLRLDELPQLFNVLRGDMNIVGPRPEQPTIFVSLREQIQGYQRRQRVRPGITGWAQINQGYDTSLEDVRRKVRYDLEYIRRQSAREDLRIMMRTLPVMVLRRGGW